MPFGLTDNSYQLIKNIFTLYPKVKEVVLFGSRALGTEKPGSDLDLALKGEGIELEDLLSINNTLEGLPLAYGYDVIDYQPITNSALQEHIDRHGIIFYQKEQVPEKWKTYRLEEVVEIQARSFRGTSQPKEDNPWLPLGHNFLIRPKSNKLAPQYLAYLLKLNSFKRKVKNLEEGAVSLNLDSMKKNEIILPELSYQQTSAAILSTFEKKINLNLQMNQTLEGMARAIFKEWFINKKEPSMYLPKGWRNGVIKDLFILTKGFSLPPAQRNSGSYPVVSANGVIGYHSEYKIKGPGVLTGCSDVSGKVYYIQDDFWPLTSSLFVAEYRNATPVFAYFMLKELNLARFDFGSALSSLDIDYIHELPCIVPPFDRVEAYERTIEIFFKRIYENEQENNTLLAIQESLLPKLLTGKLKV